LNVPQPEAAQYYYNACGQIDRHNRCRQDDLKLETKIDTMDWSMRVNMTVLCICIVETWLIYKGCLGEPSTDGIQRCTPRQQLHQFYHHQLTEYNVVNRSHFRPSLLHNARHPACHPRLAQGLPGRLVFLRRFPLVFPLVRTSTRHVAGFTTNKTLIFGELPGCILLRQLVRISHGV
jgi:hypothetical protein